MCPVLDSLARWLSDWLASSGSTILIDLRIQRVYAYIHIYSIGRMAGGLLKGPQAENEQLDKAYPKVGVARN